MESNGILSDRTNIFDQDLNSEKMVTQHNNQSPKNRPLPIFFFEHTSFSTKKERNTPKFIDNYPPRPPIKSCPPISRIKPTRKSDDAAKIISFAKNNTINKNGKKVNDLSLFLNGVRFLKYD